MTVKFWSNKHGWINPITLEIYGPVYTNKVPRWYNPSKIWVKQMVEKTNTIAVMEEYNEREGF